MDQFFADITDALKDAGIPESECPGRARRTLSEIETTIYTPATFAACLTGLTGRYRRIIEGAIGKPVERLLIAPVPNYVLAALPDIAAEFPSLVLADNFKAGTEIAGNICVTFDEALAEADSFDACLLATVDQRLGQQFRARLPAETTLAAADLTWFDPQFRARRHRPALDAFHAAIRASKRPLLVLSAYLDVTVAPTLEALNQQGYDVFIVTRRPFADGDSHITTNPAAIGTDRHFVAEFDEMLWLLRETAPCPVWVNYARFFASDWDLRNTIPLFAYSIAVLKAVTGPRILHLYDAYQVCLHGLEAELPSFALYRNLLRVADGIVVNADIVPILREAVGDEKPIISFLRYGPEAEAQAAPEPGPFSIVMITSFLGEGNDPTRTTQDAVRSLLRQEIHVHYYSSAPIPRRFFESLPDDEAPFFHLHDAIRDQRALVREISRYHAGWFVADMRCCEAVIENFATPFSRALATCFVPTTVATAGMLYGCAGLPSFFIAGHYTARLFPPDTAFELDLQDIATLRRQFAGKDWGVLRRAIFSTRDMFSAPKQIDRLGSWLEHFYHPQPPVL